METYGFTNWQALNEEARQEFEEELMAQMIAEIERGILRSMHDQLGDMTDAFNIPVDEAELLQAAVMSVLFDRLSWSTEPDADISDIADIQLEELSSDESSLREQIKEHRE